MLASEPHAPQEIKFRREFLAGAALLALPLAVVLVANPEIDLAVTGAARTLCPMTSPQGRWCETWAVTAARDTFMAILILTSLATLIATVRTLRSKGASQLAQARCLFMAAVIIMGPGVVANLILKDNLGRARPRDVIEFGGTKAFTPALVPSRECPRNCSFVSGEASSMFALFFALALLLPKYRWSLLAGGIAIGCLAGLIRILQGAHFLSDVLFAGIFMALTVSLLHIAFIGIWRDPRRTWSMVVAPFAPLTRRAATARAR